MKLTVKEYFKTLRYALYIIFHPFDGFWDMKHEKRGSMQASMTILILTVFAYMGSRQFTAFLFNYNNTQDLSVIADVATVLVLFFLWCIANWCLTTLFDGEGSFRDIMMVTGYALTPYVIINLPLILISYGFTTAESSFYYVFQSVALIWSIGLIILGSMTIHQYSMGKTVLIIVCILLGMAIILFLGLLFFSVAQQVISFVTIIFREITLRM